MWIPQPYPHRPDLFEPVRPDPTGESGPTRAEVRTPNWVRTSAGRYLPAKADLGNPEQRILTARPLVGESEAVTGWAALRWMGAGWFSGSDASGSVLPVPISSTRWMSAPTGFRISQEFRMPGEQLDIDGLSVTPADRSICFEIRHATSWREGVVALDMAAQADLVSIGEAAAYTATLNRWTGVENCRQAVQYADENAWSPRESMMRLVWECDAGLPRPLTNRPVFDSGGRLVAVPDLIDPEAGVVGEYDGAVHLVGRQRASDIRREAELRALGLEYVTMVADDWSDRGGRFIDRLHQAYRRASGRSRRQRHWSLEPPGWWRPTDTVTLRRALSESERQRLLGFRRVSSQSLGRAPA